MRCNSLAQYCRVMHWQRTVGCSIVIWRGVLVMLCTVLYWYSGMVCRSALVAFCIVSCWYGLVQFGRVMVWYSRVESRHCPVQHSDGFVYWRMGNAQHSKVWVVQGAMPLR
jgi:hypothetical protein